MSTKLFTEKQVVGQFWPVEYSWLIPDKLKDQTKEKAPESSQKEDLKSRMVENGHSRHGREGMTP